MTTTVNLAAENEPDEQLSSTIAHVEAAFETARRSQRLWAQSSLRERARIILAFGRLVLDREAELLDLIQHETGKSRRDAFEELTDVVLWSGHVANHGPALLRSRGKRGAIPLLTTTTEVRVPKGVVGIITPWNYPFTLPATDSLPALIAGNAVVLKPDRLTPRIADRLLELLLEAGLPKGVLQIVHGPGAEIGGAVIERADFVMFTGSTATGRVVARQCAERLIGFSAELGGKNPLLVLEDADVDRAAPGAVRASFANAGQLCISTERLYVHAAHWDEFCAKFVEHTEALRLGPGYDWGIDMGRLISERQLATVESHVADAVDKGARVLAGGRRRPDLGELFYEPTVLVDVGPGMIAHREETFGPVVSLYRVESDDEAIALANDSEYGLNASVWSRRNGESVARRLRAGTVNINEGYAATWSSYASPMGGMKQSGLGRRHGTAGILKYTDAQTISRQRLIPIAGPDGFGHERWAGVMSAGARILRRIP
ncbi:succinic semialdehyde dehydrogenase [Gulosibacter molinativorax]|uniref:Succinate-semialdehyde dehydrogenase (NADP(+)) n=1 Tax=Gulosibacter molinativorax TaxID=256821 RepID=A0ABT7C5Z1_9MICO|nr:succinic semialdehyde dehydrogenase [Gulosibacter molinativorax]MDJ1370513.1 succinate-semialdehyde dehydrogenase (NADP(+)) [Gulosibacter molinativorax]QUY62076.1 Succinic semialdehyde dehydrogenase [Gulosibacter molinativorax]